MELDVWNAKGRLKIVKRFWLENLLEADRFEDPSICLKITDRKRFGWKALIGFIWLWLGTGVGLL
jgi:hypothetical protein